jgi:hypothetical protein
VPRPRRRPLTGLTGLTVLVSTGLALGLLPAAPAAGSPGGHGSPGADHGSGSAAAQRAFPSREQVAHARATALRSARDVGAIKTQLLLANGRLEAAATRA